MDRKELQKLSELREKEAIVLRNNGCFDGAYYLLGYAIECAFKSCIAKQIKEHEFPDKTFITDSYTHKLTKLLELSGLANKFKEAKQQSPELGLSWGIVKDWTEESRYRSDSSEKPVRDFFEATTSQSGILAWLRQYW